MSTPAPQHPVTLRGPFGERRLPVSEDQSILDAALRSGLDLPNSCCQGWCVTCASRLIHGRVEHPRAQRYYPQDAEAGFILLRTAEPRSECLIQTHKKEELKAHRRRLGLPAPGG